MFQVDAAAPTGKELLRMVEAEAGAMSLSERNVFVEKRFLYGLIYTRAIVLDFKDCGVAHQPKPKLNFSGARIDGIV